MNISGLIRSFIGDVQAAEPKTLELKAGEVVKGLVLQLIADQEALMNIGGVQVRARLETPLKPGQIALLQVQPETTATGQVLLKPLEASAVQIADDSLGEVLKNIGMPDNGTNRQMVQTLHQAGVPLTKESMHAFTHLQAQLPAASQQTDDWVPAAVVAFQKGLPLTPDTVQAVKQAVAGPAFHESLQQLDSQMSKLLGDSPVLSESTRTALNSAKQVIALLRKSAGLLLPPPEPAAAAGGAQPATGPAGSQAAGQGAAQAGGAAGLPDQGAPLAGAPAAPGGSGPAAAANTGGGMPAPPDASGSGASAAGTAAPAASPGAPGAAAASPPAAAQTAAGQAAAGAAAAAASPGGQGIVLPAADAAQQLQQPAPAAASVGGAPATSAGAAAAVPDASDSNGGSPALFARELPQQPGSAPQSAGTGEHWISRMMKALGVEHELHIGKLPDHPGHGRSADIGAPAAAGQDAAAALSMEQQKSAETLKGALLQLLQADDVPAAVKDAAQQTVQQITGQQLLLNSDKTSMFTHMTLFVPLMNANGEQTAAIHIQSRKGPRGMIDAQNCRLVFDLQMKTLGDTMVDVQVVDKIVSLRVMNDQPFIRELLEAQREEIMAGLAGIGYQFISLKCSPYPEKGQHMQGTGTESGGKDPAASHVKAVYGTKPYRGMDVRV
ncbi:hypothetical protein [Paenibacillus piri]|uniref:Flagellar hook-length control protein FliK n=1 Tax=Paenibacillus piri TaxID=2547395 RepID=A0A4R5KRK3_9BACL|nr:hypothetical protein [Paenibacillus piri]TDF98246.1 hypothetical protein E1757_12175 [Paenibacillus piri]